MTNRAAPVATAGRLHSGPQTTREHGAGLCEWNEPHGCLGFWGENVGRGTGHVESASGHCCCAGRRVFLLKRVPKPYGDLG